MSLLSETSSAPAAETVLLREFSHRVGNEFASAVGAISLAAARSRNGEVKSALAAVENLLHNYACVHRCLRMPERDVWIDATKYLRKLCLAMSRSQLDRRGINLVFVEHEVRMDAARCWRLGLIVSELITNSARHAFGGRGGSIRVELIASAMFYKCRVSDNGCGARPVRPGQGLGIINALADGLEGSLSQEFGRRGTTSMLIFPTESHQLFRKRGASVPPDLIRGQRAKRGRTTHAPRALPRSHRDRSCKYPAGRHNFSKAAFRLGV